MIVFIAGMPRSGSTFSFNVARELLSRRGKVHQAAVFGVASARANAGDADHIIMKAHYTDEETFQLIEDGAIKAICTVRKPEDAVASWIESFHLDLESSLRDAFIPWFGLYNRIRDYALVVDHDEIEADPAMAVGRIARFLVPDASADEIATIARDHSKLAVYERMRALPKEAPGVADIGFSHYDTATFYHRDHVSSLETRSAVERIGADRVARIRAALGGYIDVEGKLR